MTTPNDNFDFDKPIFDLDNLDRDELAAMVNELRIVISMITDELLKLGEAAIHIEPVRNAMEVIGKFSLFRLAKANGVDPYDDSAMEAFTDAALAAANGGAVPEGVEELIADLRKAGANVTIVSAADVPEAEEEFTLPGYL